ncbi:MAG: four helix bundle protein [Planctomycetota bacterium]|nr:four helix bundle protein [Planctomycetota bacterium]
MTGRPKRIGDDLASRLVEFAARIGKVVDALPDTRLGRHVAGQLVRCGTAGAPNYAEARGAESQKDFIHKLGICLKELRESQCWLDLIVRADLLPEARLSPLLDESDQLIAILVKSIVTAKTRKQKP